MKTESARPRNGSVSLLQSFFASSLGGRTRTLPPLGEGSGPVPFCFATTPSPSIWIGLAGGSRQMPRPRRYPTNRPTQMQSAPSATAITQINTHSPDGIPFRPAGVLGVPSPRPLVSGPPPAMTSGRTFLRLAPTPSGPVCPRLGVRPPNPRSQQHPDPGPLGAGAVRAHRPTKNIRPSPSELGHTHQLSSLGHQHLALQSSSLPYTPLHLRARRGRALA